MPFRIAFDLDGVLADMDSELARHAKRLFGARAAVDREPHEIEQQPADASNLPPVSTLDLAPRQARELWEHVASIENFWETLAETESGIVRRLAAVAVDRRWEVIFLTRRPESAGATAQVQTQRWLEANGFPLPSVFVVQGSRGLIAAALALDFVVDDRPENCLDVVIDSRARAVLVWRDDERHLPAAARRLGIGIVQTTAECLDILAEVDSSADRPRMIDRVLRRLGLKASVTAG